MDRATAQALMDITDMSDAVLSLTPWVVELWLTVDIAAYCR